MVIFKQSDFSGGLNRQLDSAKSPENTYPLLINARSRQNVITPTNKHKRLDMVMGNYQGLYAAGNYLVSFISGNAYYADITKSPIHFNPVSNWTQMAVSAQRIFAEIVPATSNFFNRTGEPKDTSNTFNGTIAQFRQAMFVFDGINQPQAILPDGQSRILHTYDQWTKDNPEYVPVGVLPAVAANKLFLASADRRRILHSVTGRLSDFVVNVAVSGDKGGDADTVSQTVSYNDITAIKALSTNQVLVCTLYGSFVLELDYDRAIFDEPYLRPIPLFPAGAINEISIVDILQDTGFITQSGIHAFNAVAQAKRESNNYPLGAKIRGLLKNPQADTCAGLHDDFAYFAVNTIHGYGAFVYDTTTQSFQSLDLSFGRVKQFATTKTNGQERLFFITHNNEIYEAFAGEGKSLAQLYLGDWTPQDAMENLSVDTIYGILANIRAPGNIKYSVFRDGTLHESVVIQCPNSGYTTPDPIPFPFVVADKVFGPTWKLADVCRGYRIGVSIEWDVDGDFTDISAEGTITSPSAEDATQVALSITTKLAFIAESGSPQDLNPGGDFPEAGFIVIPVMKGGKYIYVANGNGVLLNGNQQILQDCFTAQGSYVMIQGTGPMQFSLHNAFNYVSVLESIYHDKVQAIIHGGGFSYPNGTADDVIAAKIPIRIPLYGLPSTSDKSYEEGKYTYAALKAPRYYSKSFEYVDFFFFDGDFTEPDGVTSDSLQAGVLYNWIERSTKPFKFVVVPNPPWTNDVSLYPGRTDLRFFSSLAISGVLSGTARCMEKFIINDFPFYTCGAAGQAPRAFQPNSTSAFKNNTESGYLLITADAISCKMEFKNTHGDILDVSYAIHV